MQPGRRFSILFLSALFLWSSVGRAEPDWSAEDEVPAVMVPSNASNEERAQAAYIRARMIQTVQYWKDRGLPNPPDLHSITYISDYRGLRVRTLVEAQNPGTPDLAQHIEAQYRHYRASRVYTIASKLEAALATSKTKSSDRSDTKEETGNEEKRGKEENSVPMTEAIFDFYAKIRYGAHIPNFYKNFQENTPLSEILESDEDAMMHDNAYYSKTPPIELTKVFKLVDPSKDEKRSAIDLLSDALDLRELTAATKKPSQFASRIVIVPRTTQTTGDADVSTLFDESVPVHELGHHLGHSLAAQRTPRGSLDRIVDEVFADYLAAAPVDNPEIGAFFAKASSIVAERLTNGDTTPATEYLAYKLKQVGEKQILRHMAERSTIDDLPRFESMSDDYTSGNPLRGMLWSLRSDAAIDREELERVLVETLIEFGQLPRLMSSNTSFTLMLRSLWHSVQTHFAKSKVSSSILKSAGVKKSEMDEDSKDRLKYSVLKIVGLQRSGNEAVRRTRNHLWNMFGLGVRPEIKADYVLPEFLRVLYRVAARQNAELSEHIRVRAVEVMNSRSVVIPTEHGPELIFPRTLRNTLNPLERFYLAWLARSTARTREALVQVRAEWESLKNMNPDLEDAIAKKDRHPLEAREAALDRRYSRRLAQRAQYERTGNPLRLIAPHPVLDTLKTVGKVGATCLSLLANAFGQAKDKEQAQEDPTTTARPESLSVSVRE